MYLTQPLHKALLEVPERTATVHGERRRSYRDLVSRVSRLAGGLRTLGLDAGDRVAILSLNSDRYMEAIYATFWAGGVINPVNIRWSPKEIIYSLDDCDSTILMVDDTFLPLLEELRQGSRSLKTVIYAGDEAAPAGTQDFETLIADSAPVADAHRHGDDLAAVMYTGGTTGKPKGVMLSHTNLYIDGLGSQAVSGMPYRSVTLHAAPTFHVAGTGLILQATARLNTSVIIPMFEPLAVLRAIQQERILEAFLVPTMIRMVLSHPDFAQYDLSSLKHLLYGASPIDSTLLNRAREALPQARFLQAYGMTELSPTVSILTPDWHTEEGFRSGKMMSAGRPLPMVEMRVVDDNDNPVPAHTRGEIVVRGPVVMQGYWNKPEQTEDALRGGWMHTGDAGYMDEDGFVYVVDRIKDMIVTGGENVYSAEVEEAVLQLPQVAQCAVIGIPDDDWGERVHAAVVLQDGGTLELDELMAHCKTLIANYKIPRSLEVRSELPLSPAGKLLKYKLREEHWGGRERQVS
ncbi:long-chain-fatty-acid--CoA ligase [Alloalcanivorax xenomutans]|jgi:acyl-CoA synthetase (AMP-forming)/AMP-acid ligase II|uniref:long-chain-fatty-acid--CoA ligase n=2 Tax=Alloalcanivorax xenomutans TaxID=1094342 RepID=UPI0003B830C7|nr:long-chain-fatty-acid--CoA ligase [Alloalcanivorax xenomutans]ERS13058.1 fatty-acid--CoA ligase [Alcanivorax sp. PN-3]MBA4720203.1 long-chain-fatty-acid--CoA ligase [Alcanivorax sp.]PHS59344.1 MAG: fatty-acid--CoA ligase [Alcanivorax sp.]CUR47369.1 Long-chain-fatty-acid--CoA ligase [Alloalcanivorax xenomutans]SOB97488.1 acyl-CoA synthetase (AMP-forming)/AMP-acid ligase II [Alloalcanivorax xenomutans]